MTEQQKESLSLEFNGLNLTRYIPEAATAVAEAKLKLADIGCAVHMCTLIHQRYGDFSQLLLEEFDKHFQGGIDKSEDKSAITSKYRLGLRLLGELTCVGVIVKQDVALSLLTKMLQDVIQADEASHTHLPVILSFARHCAEDVAGILPRKQRMLLQKYDIQPPKLKILPEASQTKFCSLLQRYFQSVKKCLVGEHKELHKRQRRDQQILQNKGELSDERKEENEKFQKSYDKLLANVSTLADVLDEDMPDLPEQHTAPEEDSTGGSIDIQFPIPKSESEMDPYSLWEDEDTRIFYECLTDLKTKVPSILYDSHPRSRSVSESASSDTTAPASSDTTVPASSDVTVPAGDSTSDTPSGTGDNEAASQEQEEIEDPDQLLAEVLEEEGEELLAAAMEVTEDHEEETSEVGGLPSQFACFVDKLPTCMSKQMVDEMATEFCMNFNSKPNRKKLVQSLFSVSKSRMDLISYYTRLVATLHPILSDIAPQLVEMLIKDFKFQVYKKDQTHIHSKLRTCRFIAELTKFGLCSKPETMRCITLLLRDFSYHNIEMTCVILEYCGRYLYRSPDSHPRAKTLLEIIVRKKDKLHLDGRQIGMIENALYYTNPPAVTRVVRKQRPPLQEYLRKLLYRDLNRANTEKILKLVRKFPWTNAEIFQYGVHCFTNIWKVKFNNIDCVANLLAGLASYQEDVVVRVIDAVLEDIRLGLELPVVNQRRISSVKFLGELYNYQLIDAALIFRVLYLFISFGCRSDGTSQQLDPVDSYSRARLVCILLDTCGQYFEHGSSKKKLDYFLVFFQCYLFNKRQPLPLELDYRVTDLMETLRPGLALYETQQEAIQAALELEKQFKEKLGSDGVITQPTQGEDSDDEDNPTDHQRNMDYEEEDEVLDVDDDIDDEVTMDDQQPSDEEETEAILKSGLKLVSCKEDDDFMAEYDKMMSDSQQSRASVDLSKVPVLDVAIPMQLKGSNQKGNVGGDNTGGGMDFKLLVKKGHKQLVRDLKVPLNSELASGLKVTQEAMKHEQNEMKRIVLNYEQMQIEEEIQEQHEAMLAVFKDQRTQQQHQQQQQQQHQGGFSRHHYHHGNRGGYHHHHGRQRHHHTEY
ncbi:regulator of nonsense transcripts 2-like isoform X2 [Dysidea avara]